MANYKSFRIDKENWSDWHVIEEPRDLSDFTTWAIKQAAQIVLPAEFASNNWWWSNGNFVCDHDGLYYYLGVTENNILVLRVFLSGTMEQTGLYRINME